MAYEVSKETDTGLARFSLAEARALISDLFRPKPAVYWTDFLLSTFLGALSFWMIRRWHSHLGVPSPWDVVLGVVSYVACVLLFYRSATFNHEIVHLPKKEFLGFRFAWNLLFGIPALMPSFTYYTHHAHHIRRLYATESDGEYLALACGPRWRIFAFLSESLIAPLLILLRFSVLTPLAYLSPRVRTFINRRLSSLVIDPNFVRPNPSQREWRVWQMQELASMLVTWVIGGLWWTGYADLFPTMFLPQAYAVAVGVLLLNSLRTLVAHRYQFPRVEVSFLDQLLDSLNFPDRLPGASLWAPVGLRFHALHHLFPTLPYHNMAEAHKRLMAGLPQDSPYRLTESPSMMHALRELWQRAGENGRTDSAQTAASDVRSPLTGQKPKQAA